VQFLDADLDGNVECMIANGHLDDYSSNGIPYRMPIHVFRLHDGRAERLHNNSIGPFFEVPRLGRAVARLDWNRDGLDDLCLTQLDEPVALLSNRTAGAGRFVSLRLRGAASDRDPIGAIVRLRAGDRSWTRQLTAGDGFAASNERRILFGVGAVAAVDEVLVEWPSGLRQVFDGCSLDEHYVLVEGAQRLLSIP
jgi:hypothetical protein